MMLLVGGAALGVSLFLHQVGKRLAKSHQNEEEHSKHPVATVKEDNPITGDPSQENLDSGTSAETAAPVQIVVDSNQVISSKKEKNRDPHRRTSQYSTAT